jgi:hypothetical protein
MADVRSTDTPPALVAALAAITGGALVLLGSQLGLTDVALALVVAVGMLLPIRVPWGGSVPMGGAAVIAIAALLAQSDAIASLAVGLVAGGIVLVCRAPRAFAVESIVRFAGSILGALLTTAELHALVAGTPPTLGTAAVASIGLVAGDLAVVRLARRYGTRIELQSAMSVHLTIVCAGILIAVAVDQVGVAMAAVAAFPLLITRFSFDRHAGATDTLDQTVQALGLVPELAGLVPLGHSERAATYAIALSHALDLDRAGVTRVVTATRLHHLGSVPVEDGEDEGAAVVDLDVPHEIAAQGANILRQAGFPADVADLLECADADTLDAQSPTLEAAIVRIASTFDEIVAGEAGEADRGLALVTANARDPYSRRTAAALLELVAGGTIVGDAIAAGDQFREAAVGVDLETVTAARRVAAELLPFARRG